MITAADVAPAAAAGAARPARQHAALVQRLLHGALFIVALSSFFALIEPSPHDLAMLVLAVVCVIAGVRFDRYLIPLLLLLTVFNIGGLFALFGMSTDAKAQQYAVTSIYLAVAALVFACVVVDDTERRLKVLRRGLICAAVIAAACGVAGYFRLAPADLFTLYGRASGTFKDPNVFAPFLILPLLFTLEPMMTRGIKLHQAAAAIVMLAGLMLAFSRGAWFHFAVSAGAMVVMLILTAPTPSARVRLVMLSGAALVLMLLLVGALLSIGSVAEMLLMRAQAVQSYDVGEGGRFRLQELALNEMLDYPLGLGPFEFGRKFGLQQHNVYLQAFLVYGWVGAFAYITLIATTILCGLRAAFIRTPWQPALIATLATFLGEALEGFIIDTDHWRHFFMILGVVWGLSAATFNCARNQAVTRA